MTVLLISAVFGFTGSARGLGPQDADSERLSAAERYAAVASLGDMWENAVQELAKGVPAERREMFIVFMRKSFRPERLRQPMIALMAKHFTAGELDALAKFYGSAKGRAVLRKFGRYMADVMPVIQEEVRRGINDFARELGSQ
ncbi:MAG: DUF2059 domain-containing protein [Bryobacteraceae bacterium]|nr:DUF2059 domain-containing protein [Bryobacteraceae bacterium]